jgi:diaminohydroxyphosphoribosylaminopyrimidine deaminase/5-amino-6-(5-phosphoribosylamino)uracil reductase
MVIDDNFYMELALRAAWDYQLLTYPNPAVGCTVINHENEILAVEAHKIAGGPHAEVLALQSAYYKLTNDEKILPLSSSHDIHNYLLANHNGCFKNTSLHVTLEPCSHEGKTPSCANLIASLGPKRVLIASQDKSEKASGGDVILKKSSIQVEYSDLHDEGDALLYPFLKWNQERFVFFKWAQRLDGSVEGGEISSFKSRTLVHQMRNVCDLLVIGGETVRTDRPTLDARLCDGKAPDVLILSRTKEFDKTIPLFNVRDRKVMIENDFEKLKSYKCIMIEGGSNMFELSKSHVDYYLSFIAPKMGGHHSFNHQKSQFIPLHVSKVEDDILIWMKLIK